MSGLNVDSQGNNFSSDLRLVSLEKQLNIELKVCNMYSLYHSFILISNNSYFQILMVFVTRENSLI